MSSSGMDTISSPNESSCSESSKLSFTSDSWDVHRVSDVYSTSNRRTVLLASICTSCRLPEPPGSSANPSPLDPSSDASIFVYTFEFYRVVHFTRCIAFLTCHVTSDLRNPDTATRRPNLDSSIAPLISVPECIVWSHHRVIMSKFDLTAKNCQYLDRHLTFPLLEFLLDKNVSDVAGRGLLVYPCWPTPGHSSKPTSSPLTTLLDHFPWMPT